MMQVKISDLIYINDAARALKKSNVMWIKNKLICIDNLNYIIFCSLDPDKLSVLPNRGIIFNQRELSKFMKAVSIESQFDIEDSEFNQTTVLSTSLSNETLIIKVSNKLDKMILDKLYTAINIDMNMMHNNEIDVSKELSQLYGLTKTAGSILYKHDCFHTMTLFNGILPLNKADLIFLTLYDNPDNTFIARFRIQKKNFNIYSYMAYLKV